MAKNAKPTKKTVAVVGLGYVGLPLALLADNKGYQVIGLDISQNRVDLINSRKSPFKDQLIQSELLKSKIKATSSYEEVKSADVVVICVPTPVYENRLPNYEPVIDACNGIGPYIQRGQLIILESTVNPGVCDEIVIPVLNAASGLSAGKDFSVAHCPERINPGDPKWNVSNIPRVVGGLDENSLDKALKFYKSIISAAIKPMGSLQEAEAVKVVENSFRNVNIAFVNELARSFAKLGIDVVNVIDGAATKPFAFMAHYPGCGVGGHCIPVDPYYLIDYAKKKNGFDHTFLKLACLTNEEMPEYTVKMVEEGLLQFRKPLLNSKVTVLGLSYKRDIDDIRESPALEIIKLLTGRGVKVTVFDPNIKQKSDVQTLDAALLKADAVIIATDHKEFKAMKPEELIKNKIKVVIDGRNCLSKKAYVDSGIYYRGIGR